jgi:hypothetical protein
MRFIVNIFASAKKIGIPQCRQKIKYKLPKTCLQNTFSTLKQLFYWPQNVKVLKRTEDAINVSWGCGETVRVNDRLSFTTQRRSSFSELKTRSHDKDFQTLRDMQVSHLRENCTSAIAYI